MLNDSPARDFFGRVFKPIGEALSKVGVHPNTVTIVGTLGTILAAFLLVGRGHLFAGCLVITFFVFLDLLDGAMARATGKVSKFGAVLDATGDRLSDAAIFASIAYWYGMQKDDAWLLTAALLCLVLGQVTSYVKARAEGVGLSCNVGIAERAERLIIALVGLGLQGVGVPYVLDAALWLLTAISAYTVWQRMRTVYLQSSAELAEKRPA
ncbi:phosphatidylinositol phosphate synthase [Blastococcus sp. Marseille-P5729]|uniref:phosphatidylinositol phosphate synthase n=1 Tax=Blastococcus sp. Marseille-P5729 TaxID=2086582 RepID=UPI000D111329|nr:CDP-alcohol phosphatidyltransferase family protein [Blastococcus sp. Marseille-P5729]